MASVDMCRHDWPGSGCDDCKREGHRERSARLLQEIAAERRRQVEAEGWTPEHDDEHNDGQMADAAACYAKRAIYGPDGPRNALPGPPGWWPWDASWWKPADQRRMLIKAAALLLAEIERLDRRALALSNNQPEEPKP